jgi:carbon-monoxide dehydrogenase medium subunit
VKPAAFEYVVAESVEAALAALAEANGDAKILAGGQSLVPMLNFRLLRPRVLIDINRIPGLAFIEDDSDVARIGALTRHYTLETSPIIAEHFPMLAAAMTHVGHLAIRNRGTIGGSLSHGDPAAELPMMALLLDAELQVASRKGKRTVAARDFFRDALTVDIADGEMLTEIRLPKLPPGTGWGFEEVSRRAGDFALAAAAATITMAGGNVAQARLAVTGVGPTPVRVSTVESSLIGKTVDEATLNNIAAAVCAIVMPNTDLHASADYRRHLAGVLAARALGAAWRRARSGSA